MVMLVVLVLFGAKKIPEFARNLGKGISEFKKASREVTDELNATGTPAASTPPPAAQPPTVTVQTAQPATPPPTNPGPPVTKI